MNKIYRNEYPRPNLVRKKWICLNGEWDFEFDDNNIGQMQKWYKSDKKFSGKINVPFAFQSKLSGINDTTFHDIVWYKRKFKVPNKWLDDRIILNFGAVDYRSKIYINGEMVGEHEGGHTSFSFDVTSYLTGNEEEITVYVEDPSEDETIPRGKQYWKEKSESIWYTRTTGIWQSVWIEPINEINISNIKFMPDVDKGNINIEFELSKVIEDLEASIEISFKNKVIVKDKVSIIDKYNNREINLFNKKIFRSPSHNMGWCWSPESPNLFDVKIVLRKYDVILDSITTYFGMRKIHTENGMIYLNNKPYYEKLVLDQGYWPDGLLTAPYDENYINDIKLTKQMGFNGCRKHQKVEDPRFLYWADKLGLLVWEEMANCAEYSLDSVERTIKEWIQVIKRDYNHPCIVAWVPINESWGVPQIGKDKLQQSHSLSLYYLTHSIDNSRVVISNDGWELTKTDICAVHNYCHGNKEEKEKYQYFIESLYSKENILKSQPGGKKIYADGFHHQGEPIMLTEFGGIAYDKSSPDGWGYTKVSTEKEFLEDYERVIDAIYNSQTIYGFCYTQLTDVEQEVNGLLTYDRQTKCSAEKIKKINDKYRNNIVW